MISLAALFLILATVVGVGAGVTILPTLLQQRRQISPNQAPQYELQEVERLRIEVGDLQSEIASLTERMDFTEKLLSGRAEAPRLDTPERDAEGRES